MAIYFKYIFAGLIFAVFIFTPAVFAQDAGKLIDEAKRSYDSGNYNKTKYLLELSLKKINERVYEKLNSTLPPPPKDFVVVKPEDGEISKGARAYKSLKVEDGEIYVNIESVSEKEETPLETEAPPINKKIDIKGKEAFMRYYPDTKMGDLKVILKNGRVYIDATGFEDPAILIDFARQMNFNKIEEALQE